MSSVVQVRRPIIVPTRVLVGNPVAAPQQWTDVAQAAMYVRGKGAVLVPACAPMTEIKTTAEQVYRFRVKPRSSAVQRVWSIVCYQASGGVFTETTVNVRAPATTGTLQSATATSASALTEIRYVETLSSKNATEAEISIGIACPGASASGAVFVAMISCREQDRPVLTEDATDVPTRIETVRPGEPIGGGSYTSLGGALASLAAMDARRVGIFHYASSTAISRTSATPANLLAIGAYIQGPKVNRTATTQSVRWAAYAGMSSGGGSGAVTIATSASGVSDSVAVTSATPGWIDGGTVSILCDDFSQSDGQVDDLLTITYRGDGTRSINLYSVSMWVEDVS
jgi:hypothetical protein